MIRFKTWYDIPAMTSEERRLYNVWKSMKARCTNPNSPVWKYYGGRGIKVCDRWLNSFKDYVDDVGIPSDPSLELDRINNDGNYEPGNVRYVTRIENLRNLSNNHHVTIDGVTKTMCEWADEYGIDRPTFHSRLKMGWEGRRLLSTPRVKAVQITIDGITKSSVEWAASIPMCHTGFRHRYFVQKLRGPELLRPSKKKQYRTPAPESP